MRSEGEVVDAGQPGYPRHDRGPAVSVFTLRQYLALILERRGAPLLSWALFFVCGVVIIAFATDWLDVLQGVVMLGFFAIGVRGDVRIELQNRQSNPGAVKRRASPAQESSANSTFPS
jgi:hypothetical protein